MTKLNYDAWRYKHEEELIQSFLKESQAGITHILFSFLIAWEKIELNKVIGENFEKYLDIKYKIYLKEDILYRIRWNEKETTDWLRGAGGLKYYEGILNMRKWKDKGIIEKKQYKEPTND